MHLLDLLARKKGERNGGEAFKSWAGCKANAWLILISCNHIKLLCFVSHKHHILLIFFKTCFPSQVNQPCAEMKCFAGMNLISWYLILKINFWSMLPLFQLKKNVCLLVRFLLFWFNFISYIRKKLSWLRLKKRKYLIKMINFIDIYEQRDWQHLSILLIIWYHNA